MKVVRRAGGDERAILTAMIVDKTVLGAIAGQWPKGGLFASKYANLVGGWCVRYYNQYGRAPGPVVERLFEAWANKAGSDKATSALVERLLNGLSKQYTAQREASNSQFILDLASKYFNRVRYQQLVEALQTELDNDNDEAVEAKLNNWGKVELGNGAGVDPMVDAAVWVAAFAEGQAPLVTYPGALGQFFGNALQRDAFIAFTAPEKRGKSLWLMDLAWRAICQRRRVAFFEVGDMSQAQILGRWGSRAARKPLAPCKLLWPEAISRIDGEKFATVTSKEKKFDEALSWNAAFKACQRAMEKVVRSKNCFIKLSCHANSSINVTGLRGILDGWQRDGWIPDIVIVDYADILGPPAGVQEGREQINTTWKQLRRMSQELHCLVVTATQSDAASYGKYIITMKNFSDDKRKHAHVTGTIGINQCEEERDEAIMRLNWVVRRNAAYNERRCVHVAGCLALAMPAIQSTW